MQPESITDSHGTTTQRYERIEYAFPDLGLWKLPLGIIALLACGVAIKILWWLLFKWAL